MSMCLLEKIDQLIAYAAREKDTAKKYKDARAAWYWHGYLKALQAIRGFLPAEGCDGSKV